MTDTEDVLQEAWLRWAEVDLDAVLSQRAYLVTITTRQALVLRVEGGVDTVLAVRVDDGLVTGLYAVRSPEKLSRPDPETTLTR